MKLRRGRWALAAVLVLAALAALGPRAALTESWVEPAVGPDVDAFLAREEAPVRDLRPGDGKEVVWLDGRAGSRTPLSLVYLHGFSADRHEVEPLVSRLASALGANLYFTRLAGHGRDARAMGEASAEAWLDDTAEAFAVGAAIGERVVLVGTSTGGTLATWAAAREETAGRLAALVLISPNYQPRDRASRILLWPWGGLIAWMVEGSERCFEPLNAGQARHWTTCYPTSVLLPMMALVEHVRRMDLGGITVPALVVYSPEDRVVDPLEVQRLFPLMGSRRKSLYRVRGPAEVDHHVLAGDILSPGTTDEVFERVLDFLEPLAAPASR